MSATPAVAVASGCELGEGPIWDHRIGRLWWVDIYGPAIWSLDPDSGRTARLPMPERVGFVLLTPDPSVLVAGLKSGLKLVEARSGRMLPIAAPEPDLPGNRLNDGATGPDGAIWFGSMDTDCVAPSGRFWRWRAGHLSAFGPGIACTNGPAISGDGRTLYAVDTMNGVIHAVDIAAGEPGPFRPHIRFSPEDGYPDGVILDAEDHLWVGHWGGARLSRYRPDGTVEHVIRLPAAQATKCAFGGPDLRTLYVTTAALGRDRAAEPDAGHLFSLRLDVAGRPAAITGGLDPFLAAFEASA